jgi:hypothetical protein
MDVSQTWTTVLICSVCGASFIHVELSPDRDDEPDGLPPGLPCGNCGALDSFYREGTN